MKENSVNVLPDVCVLSKRKRKVMFVISNVGHGFWDGKGWASRIEDAKEFPSLKEVRAVFVDKEYPVDQLMVIDREGGESQGWDSMDSFETSEFQMGRVTDPNLGGEVNKDKLKLQEEQHATGVGIDLTEGQVSKMKKAVEGKEVSLKEGSEGRRVTIAPSTPSGTAKPGDVKSSEPSIFDKAAKEKAAKEKELESKVDVKSDVKPTLPEVKK